MNQKEKTYKELRRLAAENLKNYRQEKRLGHERSAAWARGAYFAYAIAAQKVKSLVKEGVQ